MKFSILLLLALICGVALMPTASAGSNNEYISQTFSGDGSETQVAVDVSTTNATNYKLQRRNEDGSYTTIQDATVDGQQSFTFTLDARLVPGNTYRVKGNTSAQGGPYAARATAS